MNHPPQRHTPTLKHGAVLLLFALLAAPAAAAQTDFKPDTAWEGLWVSERQFGPTRQGPLTLVRSAAGWFARHQGDSVRVTQTHIEDGPIEWSFSFADQGQFIGHQSSTTAPIQGHWIQPPGAIESYPIATPVTLRPAGDYAFAGHIRPFRHDVSLNIPLRDGRVDAQQRVTYRSFLRNPQRNFGVFFRIASATITDQHIEFLNADGDTLARADVLEPGQRFALVFGRTGNTLEFTRREQPTAPGFYPRRLPLALDTLPQPPQLNDGWLTARPNDSGLDATLLGELINEIATFTPTGLRQPYIHSVLIAHRGQLVVEEYFHGYDRETPHDSRSAGKTIASVLLGATIHQGYLANEYERVYPLFGGVDQFANADPRKANMTLHHLITMSSGFDCDDDDESNVGNENVMQNQREQPDWRRYTLSLPMVRDPGAAGVYCTGALNVIGGAIERATQQRLPRFFHDALAQPLGITYYQMNLAPDHRAYMGGGLRLRPRDFLKIGQLYLNQGRFNDQQIVSKAWVEKSFQPHASLNRTNDYGYAWWRQTFVVDEEPIETFYASGNGGQLLFVVPAYALTVMINAGNYSDGRTRNQFRDRFMQRFILPAAVRGSGQQP
ncbi:MAG: serine hydrolase [Pseudomonadota bacterium]